MERIIPPHIDVRMRLYKACEILEIWTHDKSYELSSIIGIWKHGITITSLLARSGELWISVLWENLSSVQFSHSVVFDSLRPHESQYAKPPYPSPTPGVHSDSHPSSQWCHPAISSSVIPFSSWPQSLPASESFPMSQLFPWGGQSTGVSALASLLPKKFYSL